MRFPRVSLSDMAFSPHGVGEQPIPLPYVFRPLGGRLRRDRLEPGVVRIMAMSAQQVLLPPVPLSRALSVDAHPPVPVLVSVALAAEPVAVAEVDLLPGHQPQFVAVFHVMAIPAPPLVLGVVLQLDIRVLLLRSEEPP